MKEYLNLQFSIPRTENPLKFLSVIGIVILNNQDGIHILNSYFCLPVYEKSHT